VGAITISGILGTAINIVLAFCAGTDMDGIFNSEIGQPMATVRATSSPICHQNLILMNWMHPDYIQLTGKPWHACALVRDRDRAVYDGKQYGASLSMFCFS
jgi:hypothetical protein